MSEIKKLPGNIDFGADNRRAPSTTPLAKGAPTATRQSDNTTPNRITPDLKTRLTTMNPEIASRVRAVVSRKPGR